MLKTDCWAAIDRIWECWLSNVSHEMASPLFAVRGYVRLMLEQSDGDLSPANRCYLSRISESVDRLIASVKELHDGPAVRGIGMERVDFCDLLHSAVVEVGAAAFAEQKVQLIERGSHERLTIMGNREVLGKALRGFLSSAVRTTDPNGLVEISSRPDDDSVTLQITAIRYSSPLEVQTDLLIARKLWALHGGSTSVTHASEKYYSLVCELPRILEVA